MNQSPEIQPASLELQASKLYEAISSAEHVTVEFGTGDMPLFDIQDTHTFDARNLYVGINIDSKQHKFLTEKVRDIDGYALLSEKNKEGSIDKITIPDNSVDTVFMANVFGEPDSQHIMEPFKDSDGLYRGNTDLTSKIDTLHEAGRLLKEGGKVVILENNTPYKAGFSGNYDSMMSLLEDEGLRVVDAVNQKDADWAELVTQFAKPAEWWSHSSYIVIAQKLEQ